MYRTRSYEDFPGMMMRPRFDGTLLMSNRLEPKLAAPYG
jgi:hypothetical protein